MRKRLKISTPLYALGVIGIKLAESEMVVNNTLLSLALLSDSTLPYRIFGRDGIKYYMIRVRPYDIIWTGGLKFKEVLDLGYVATNPRYLDPPYIFGAEMLNDLTVIRSLSRQEELWPPFRHLQPGRNYDGEL